MGLANMHLFLGLVPFVLYGLDFSFATSGFFDDGENAPWSYPDIFSSDQADLDASEFTVFPGDYQEDLGPLALNDQLDWSTDDLIPYLDDGGNDDYISFQQDPYLGTTAPSCAFDVSGTQELNKKKRDLPENTCPSPFAAPDDGDPQIRGPWKQPLIDPGEPPDPANPGIPLIDHADIRDFYEDRDRETIRGYIPGKYLDSICGDKKFTVCDSGDPYFRIPQVPPLYALEKCFICMFGLFFPPFCAVIERI